MRVIAESWPTPTRAEIARNWELLRLARDAVGGRSLTVRELDQILPGPVTASVRNAQGAVPRRRPDVPREPGHEPRTYRDPKLHIHRKGLSP